MRSKQLYYFFKSLKEDFSKAEPFIEEYPADFIQGLADSEGCPGISANQTFALSVCVAYSTNLELLTYTSSLLRIAFSICSSVRLHKKAGEADSVIDGRPIKRTKNVYGLRIGSISDTRTFSENIGFSIVRKQGKLENAIRIVSNFETGERI